MIPNAVALKALTDKAINELNIKRNNTAKAFIESNRVLEVLLKASQNCSTCCQITLLTEDEQDAYSQILAEFRNLGYSVHNGRGCDKYKIYIDWNIPNIKETEGE